jgi:hypothetical protein
MNSNAPSKDRALNLETFKKYRRAMAVKIAEPAMPWKQYCEYIYRDDKNKRIKCPPHQIEIFKFIDDSFAKGFDKVAIEAPWGHSKTQSVAVFYASRQIGLNRNIREKICSSNDPIATLRVCANKNIIALNDDYRHVFPHIRPGDKWGESAFRIVGAALSTTDYTMQAGGVNSSVIGGRADLFILDDPCDLNNSMTEEVQIGRAHV